MRAGLGIPLFRRSFQRRIPEQNVSRFEMGLCGADHGAIVETGVPIATSLWGEVHEVPDGSEQVDAALFDVWGHPGMSGIEMARSAISIAGEH